MPRVAKSESIADVIGAAVETVADRMLAVINRHIERSVAAQVGAAMRKKGVRTARGARPASRPVRVEITRWVPDRRARRVPNFVIEATGLKTKKQIVAKFGENVTFEKGKPTPKPAKAA
jgi:hypothetical protein